MLVFKKARFRCCWRIVVYYVPINEEFRELYILILTLKKHFNYETDSTEKKKTRFEKNIEVDREELEAQPIRLSFRKYVRNLLPNIYITKQKKTNYSFNLHL